LQLNSEVKASKQEVEKAKVELSTLTEQKAELKMELEARIDMLVKEKATLATEISRLKDLLLLAQTAPLTRTSPTTRQKICYIWGVTLFPAVFSRKFTHQRCEKKNTNIVDIIFSVVLLFKIDSIMFECNQDDVRWHTRVIGQRGIFFL
jgi:hypothetical protein